MFEAIVFIYAVFYLILTRLRPDWALYIIIFALPSYLIRFSVAGIPFTILELMILLSFASWIFDILAAYKFNLKHYWRERKTRVPYPFRLEIALWLVIAYLAAFIAGFDASALGIFKAYFFEPVLFFILVINILGKDKKAIKKIIFSLATAAILVSLLAIYQKVTGNLISNEFWAAAATRRATSFFGFPNAIGLYLGPIVVLLASYLYKEIFYHEYERKLLAVGYIAISLVLSILAIYAAKSEGALIGIIAAAAVYGLLADRKLRQVTITAIVISITIIFSTPTITNYVKNKITLNDLSGQIRRQQWIETKKMMVNDNIWLWGTGLSGYQSHVAPYHQEGIFVKNDDPNWLQNIRNSAEYRQKVWQPTEIYMYPHNVFLNFWTELGLLGLLLFVWIIIKYGIKAIVVFQKEKSNHQHDAYLTLGLFAALVAIIVHGLVDVPYFKNDLSVFFFLLLALLGLRLLPERKEGANKIKK